MSSLPHAFSFRDLVVYQKSRVVALQIFQDTKSFPKEETYALTDQVRRSSRSVGAQITEAWAKRRYEKHFVSKLTDADGEQLETQHWVETAADCGYLSKQEVDGLISALSEIGRLLNSMINKSDSFCGQADSTLHESAPEYFTTTGTDD